MSENLGFGVMLGMLSGNSETVETLKAALGKTITELSMVEDQLLMRFADGTGLKVWDGGQSCCESRYMKTDDDLPYFVGGTLMGMELRSSAPVEEEYQTHEIQFLDVTTSKGMFQMATHNEHNGYYGGFWIQISPLSPAPTPAPEKRA